MRRGARERTTRHDSLFATYPCPPCAPSVPAVRESLMVSRLLCVLSCHRNQRFRVGSRHALIGRHGLDESSRHGTYAHDHRASASVRKKLKVPSRLGFSSHICVGKASRCNQVFRGEGTGSLWEGAPLQPLRQVKPGSHLLHLLPAKPPSHSQTYSNWCGAAAFRVPSSLHVPFNPHG